MPYVAQALADGAGPVVAALDYVSAVGLSIAPWITSTLPLGEGPGVKADGIHSCVVLGAWEGDEVSPLLFLRQEYYVFVGL